MHIEKKDYAEDAPLSSCHPPFNSDLITDLHFFANGFKHIRSTKIGIHSNTQRDKEAVYARIYINDMQDRRKIKINIIT